MQGSWRMSLRNSFKNFRRDHPTDENGEPIIRCGAASKDLEPPSKRMRSSPVDSGQELTDDQYQEAVQELKTEYRKGRKGGRNYAVLNKLMEKTRKRRREWIQGDRPLVSEVIAVFPCLETSRTVSSLQVHVSACEYMVEISYAFITRS